MAACPEPVGLFRLVLNAHLLSRGEGGFGFVAARGSGMSVCTDVWPPLRHQKLAAHYLPWRTRVLDPGLVAFKNSRENLKNPSCSSNEMQSGGGAEKSLGKKVVRPQALEGVLKPPTFNYHFFTKG